MEYQTNGDNALNPSDEQKYRISLNYSVRRIMVNVDGASGRF